MIFLDLVYPNLRKDIIETKKKVKEAAHTALVPFMGFIRKTAFR
jgi:hypothetical protein